MSGLAGTHVGAPVVPDRVARIKAAPFDALNARAAVLRAEGRPVISLGQAVPHFGPPDSALAAARQAIDRTETHLYSSDAGMLSLRTALCERLAGDLGLDIGGVAARDHAGRAVEYRV